MHYGIPCEIKNEKFYLLINSEQVTFERTQEIPDRENSERFAYIVNTSNIVSIQVKNEEDVFYLKIMCKEGKIEKDCSVDPDILIISFKSHLDRDIVKSLIVFVEKEQKLPLEDTEEKELNKQLSRYDFSKDKTVFKSFRNNMAVQPRKGAESYHNFSYGNFPSDIQSKNDLFVILLGSPLLLTIYSLIQSTPKQFFNLLRFSYFFNQQNTKNVIDRRIEEITGYEIDFASRLNHKIGKIENIQIKEKPFNEKEIPFVPVYPFEEDSFQELKSSPDSFAYEHNIVDLNNLVIQLDPLEITDVRDKTENMHNHQSHSEVLHKLDQVATKHDNSTFERNLIRISRFVWENRNNHEKKEELGRLCERVEAEIENKALFKRVLPSFFLKQGENTENEK